MVYALDSVAIPLVLFAVLVGTIIAISGSLRDRYLRTHHRSLPHGADAALWSVTEVIPDPRNHLAIKDPTSQLILTDEDRAFAAEAAAEARQRAERSPQRPARVAAEEQLVAAREAARIRRAELARERQRRELAERDPAAFSSPDVVDTLGASTGADIELLPTRLPIRVAS